MKVSRIEVFGFKSFMDRVVLPFEGGITGVVGPNGCGKSNIVDALRWVLGETRASQLRGGVLEDVIFNGTDKLRPLGLAEVTLSLKSSSNDEDILTEVARSEVNTAEILESFKIDELTALPDTVGYSSKEESRNNDSISQSANNLVPLIKVEKVESEINSDTQNSEDNEIPVTVTGVSPESIAQKIEVAVVDNEVADKDTTKEQKSSSATDPFSRRFGWMKGLKEIQVTRRFYRSGESEYFINKVPCRLKDLKDLFRACGLGARTYTIVAQGEIARIVNAKPEDRRLIVEEAAGIMGFRERMNEATRRLTETKNNLQRILDVEKELARQVNSLKRQAQRAIARKEMKEELFVLDEKLFNHNILTLSNKLDTNTEELEALIKEENNFEQALHQARQSEEEMRGELSQYDVSLREVRSKIDRLKDQLNEMTQNRLRQVSKIQEMKAFKSARVSETERLEERTQTLASRKVATEEEIKQLEIQDKEISEKMQKGDNGEEELRKIAQELNATREELRKKEFEIREVREKMSSIDGNLNAINDQLIAASPLNQLKKSFNNEFAQKILPNVKAFIDGIHVEGKFNKALQALLAEKAGFLIAENPHTVAQEFIAVFGNRSDKNKKGEGLGILKIGESTGTHTPVEIEGAHPVLTTVKIDAGFGLSAEALFKDCYFVEDFQTAVKIIENSSNVTNAGILDRAIFVTLAGEITTAKSFYALYHEGGLLQLRSKQQTLKDSHVELKARYENLATERDQIQQNVKSKEQRHAEILREIQERQAQQREFGRQQGSIRGRIYAGKNTIGQISADIERTHSMIADSKKRTEEIELQIKELEENTASLQDVNPEEVIKTEIAESTKTLATVEEDQRTKARQMQEKVKVSSEARSNLDKTRSRKSQLEIQIEKLKLEAENLKHRIVNDYGSEVLDAWVNTISSLNETVIDETVIEVEGTEDSTENSETALREPILTEQALILTDEELSVSESRANEIRTRISKEGEVDSTSIERFEEENARLEPLKIQREDLEKATATLEKSIAELRATSAERFIATYERVRESFSTLAPRLYGGGQADLELSNPENPLESGMNLLVRPPGKKPKSIDMLSGGEKALCATALIFSLFLERPSPICVLDEVDAPLDDANLLRFLSLIEEMSKRTQFLMITHNKQSMTTASNLVGVTMQQPGVTKFISVSLDEAIEQVVA